MLEKKILRYSVVYVKKVGAKVLRIVPERGVGSEKSQNLNLKTAVTI